MIKRPDPDALLAQIREESEKKTSGKLKIFLGASPGVGKTFSMLEEAASLKDAGTEVLIGLVETHGRHDTAELVEGFSLLPRKKIPYQGKELEEFDLDAAIKRRPQLMLLDEMAHTNVPGSRHTKRWQDIQELLDCGIDVYTTLNIQHLESLNDVIYQITEVRIRETVPDFAVEQAEKIELVDLPPDDLIKRLDEGKVYLPGQIALAKENFFKKSNLTALRELALRLMAQQVNTQVLNQRRDQAVQETWPTSERLLVCIGPGSGSAKLVRAAKRMASDLHSEWLAVYVEAPWLKLSDTAKQSVGQNLRLAEQLGAETIRLTGDYLVEEIMSLARSRNINKIMISKNLKPNWKNFFKGSLTDQLIQASGEIDIYVIRADSPELGKVGQPWLQRRTSWPAYFFSAIVLSLITVLSGFVQPYLEFSNIIMLYLLGILIVAINGRRGPAIMATLASVVLSDYFFVKPFYSFAIGNMRDTLTLLVMLVMGLFVSNTTVVIRQQAERARLREQRIAALHALSEQLASHRGVEQLLKIASSHIAGVFDSQVLAMLPETGKLLICASYPNGITELDAKEMSVAQWVFDRGQMAGLGTQTLPFSEALYLPLGTRNQVLGVLSIKPNGSARQNLNEQMHLLESFVNQTALALEVDYLEAQAKTQA